MNLAVNFTCMYQDMRRFFAQCDEVSIIVLNQNLTFISSKNGISRVKTFGVTVDTKDDIDNIMLGYTVIADLLLKLPAKGKSLDSISIRFNNDVVLMKVNEYGVKMPGGVFDRRTVEKTLQSIQQPNEINVSELIWLYNIGKNYKDSVIEVMGNLAFCKTTEAVYVQRLKTAIDYAFGFPTAMLKSVATKPNVKATFGSCLVFEFEDGSKMLTNVYKPTTSLADDFKFASKLKSKVKMQLNLSKHRDFLKILRGSDVRLDIGDSSLLVKSEKGEELRLHLGNNLQVDIAESNDYSKLLTLFTEANKIRLSSVALLKAIAQERAGVSIYITPYIYIIKFSDNSYSLVSRVVS